MISARLEKTIQNAYEIAKSSNHEFMTLEHLLKSLCYDEDAISLFKACKINIKTLTADLEGFFKNELSSIMLKDEVNPRPSVSFERVLKRAAHHVQTTGNNKRRSTPLQTVSTVITCGQL